MKIVDNFNVFFSCDEAKSGDFVPVGADNVFEAEEKAWEYFTFHDLHNVHVSAVAPIQRQ